MDVRAGLYGKLNAEELMLLNCGVGEDSWESLGLQGDPISHPKGDQSWIFTGRTDAEAEAPIIWPPEAKSWLIGKDPDAGKDWRQEEKVKAKDELAEGITDSMDMNLSTLWKMVKDREAWNAAVSPWGYKELDTTEWLNWTEGFLHKSFLLILKTHRKYRLLLESVWIRKTKFLSE